MTYSRNSSEDRATQYAVTLIFDGKDEAEVRDIGNHAERLYNATSHTVRMVAPTSQAAAINAQPTERSQVLGQIIGLRVGKIIDDAENCSSYFEEIRDLVTREEKQQTSDYTLGQLRSYYRDLLSGE